MAEVLCPVCGKSNPPDLEFCQKCQSRLKLVVDPFSLEDEDIGSPDPFRLDGATDSDHELDANASIPDWLQSEHLEDGDELGEASSADSIPDWLAGENTSSGPKKVDDEKIAASWLTGEDLGEEEIPDWLSSLGSGETAITGMQPIEEQEESFADEEEEPDWLSRVRARKSAEEGEQIDHGQPDRGLEDWSEGESVQIEDTSAEIGGEEYPDWLSESGEFTPDEEKADQIQLAESKDDVVIDDISDPETEIPEWVAGLRAAEVISDAGIIDDQVDAEVPEWIDAVADIDQGIVDESEDVPAWVTGLAGAGAASDFGDIVRSEEEPESEGIPEWQVEAEESLDLGEEIAAPIGDIGLDADTVSPQELVSVDKFLELEATDPELGGEAIDLSQLEEQDEDLFDTEVAEWLSDLPSQEELDGEIAAKKEEVIEPADLPIWLAAMRPVDAVSQEESLPDEKIQRLESTGPLAGLSGILPAEPAIGRVKKTSAYAIKLRVSDSQQAHAGMLEELIKNEGTVEAIPERARISSQHILRIGIFVILLLAVIWPVLTSSVNVPLPSLAPETLEARKIVDTVSGGAPVLLAVEYEPGFSAEMDAASASLVDHLMIKGAYLTLVSTSTMGPAQAERLVGVINQSTDHNYQPSRQYVNLGYIPGGPTGLLGFANTPHLVLPFALDNSPVWESGPLANIQDISDFELVVVITEDSDSARAWIEQVQPAMLDTPLVMVVSAQAEPMVRPYYEGSPQQVNGLVTGLAGGASYEGTMPRTSLARKYWDAFSFGLLAAVVLIALGGVIVAAFSSLNKGDQTDENKTP